MTIIINSNGHELDVNDRTLPHVGKKQLKDYRLKSEVEAEKAAAAKKAK